MNIKPLADRVVIKMIEAEETAPEEVEGEAESTTVTEDATPSAEVSDTVQVQYNHEAKSIDRSAAMKISESLGMSVEDLVSNLQKGMNYDTLENRINSKNNESLQALRSLAARTGKTETEIITAIESTFESVELQNAAEKIRKENPDLDDDVVERMARMQAELDKKSRAETAASNAEAERVKAPQPWVDFFIRYPGLAKEPVPEEVIKAVVEGESPTVAYLEYLLDKKDVELKQMQKDAEVKKKNTGSTKAQFAEDNDPFLEGFDSDIW